MPELLNAHALATLILIVFAFLLFIQDKIRLETSSLIILILLTLGFQLFPFVSKEGSQFSPADFFLGFGHEALLTICALMILGQGIEANNGLKPLTSVLAKHWNRFPKLCLAITLLMVAVLSGFLNNTPIVVMLLPVLIGVALNSNKSPSKMLIPMGLASLIGGTATSIGTSTNLLVIAIAVDLGLHQFGMFDFALPVLLVGSFGLVYLIVIAPLLLPDRQVPLSKQDSRKFKAMLMIDEESLACDKMLKDILKLTDYKMEVNKISRGSNYLLTLPTVKLKAGDGLITSGTADELIGYCNRLKARLHNIDDHENPISSSHPLATSDQVLAEILVTENSALDKRTLKQTRFADLYELVVLALHRVNRTSQTDKEIADIRLRRGDILLVQGETEKLQKLKANTRLLMLNNVTNLSSSGKAPLALAIMFLVVLLAAFQLLPISVSALTGVGVMLMTRCIKWREIASALKPSVIMIVVVSLALGKAMMVTGADGYLGHVFVAATTGLSSVAILAALIFLMALLTNVVSNTAAAVIGTPVAINIAMQIGAPVEPFILAVLFGVNMSYATPIGYQTNLLIYSAGGYKFSDFIRVGVPLTLLMGTGFTAVLAVIYQI